MPNPTGVSVKQYVDKDGCTVVESRYTNEHNNGCLMRVAQRQEGLVDYEFYQIIDGLKPDDPSLSLAMPVVALAAFMAASDTIGHAAFDTSLKKLPGLTTH